MRYFLGFKNIQYFHLWILAFFYLPQSFFGFYLYDSRHAFLFLGIALVSVFGYIFFYTYVFGGRGLRAFVNRPGRWSVDVGNFSYLIFGFYFLLIAYVVATSEQIALLMVFEGASVDELAQSREMFLRTRVGWEVIIPYINALFVMALLPYSIASLFYTKHKFRFYFLVLFLFCLTLTLEKSVAILAIAPLIILAVNSKRGSKGFWIIVFLVAFIAAVSFLARGGGQVDVDVGGEGALSMPEKYQILKCDAQICYLFNRVTWIPYATAVDWLTYQEDVLGGGYLLGQSIGVVALIFNVPKINMERDVFEFQWGQNASGTGSSNTVYFIDAFVNFSWFGVILYSAVVALFVKILAISDNVPVKCAAFASLFYLGFNSLPPMFFSGGLIIVLLLALLFRHNNRSNV